MEDAFIGNGTVGPRPADALSRDRDDTVACGCAAELAIRARPNGADGEISPQVQAV